nr:cyclic pyranopterin monophosphate synthase MoaC [Leptospira bandrabouensis]
MIDITEKKISLRSATAEGFVYCTPETLKRIKENSLPKGDLFGVAKASGLLASKKTSDLIPHCHPVNIDSFDLRSAERFSKTAQTDSQTLSRIPASA